MSYSQEVKEFHRYCPGVPESSDLRAMHARQMKYLEQLEKDPTKHSTGPNRHLVDLAWVIAMQAGGLLSKEEAGKLLKAIRDIKSGKIQVSASNSHGYAERNLIEALDGDEDLASMVNLGRTLQEPMFRLDLRDMLLDTFDEAFQLLKTVLMVAKEHIDTIMPGHTHMSQAQPITLAHYLLSVFDSMQRGFEQLELAYAHTNLNSGGCGATSGIAWPISREYVTELLGFDGLIEPSYDSEASQDHSMSILFALTNITLVLSKSSMDMNIWSLEELDMIRVDPSWCGVSSLMPNKCIPGSLLERSRVEASYVAGLMMQGVLFNKGEPHGDMLPMLEPPKVALLAMIRAMTSMGYYRGVLGNMTPQKEKLLEYVRTGFSCSSEVSSFLVKEKNYGPRRAHRITATMVRMARERGIKAYEATGALLDEAARFAEEAEPNLSTEKLLELLDPKRFIASHSHTGGTSRDQAERMIASREQLLGETGKRIHERRQSVEAAIQELHKLADQFISE